MNTVTGLEETIRRLASFGDNARREIASDIISTAYEIHAEAVQNVPIQTGNLKQSGFVDAVSELKAEITFNEDYAPFVEFGTGGEVDVPSGWESFAMQFKGRGVKTVNLPARPFLIPAFKNGIRNLDAKLLRFTNVNRRL